MGELHSRQSQSLRDLAVSTRWQVRSQVFLMATGAVKCDSAASGEKSCQSTSNWASCVAQRKDFSGPKCSGDTASGYRSSWQLSRWLFFPLFFHSSFWFVHCIGTSFRNGRDWPSAAPSIRPLSCCPSKNGVRIIGLGLGHRLEPVGGVQRCTLTSICIRASCCKCGAGSTNSWSCNEMNIRRP